MVRGEQMMREGEVRRGAEGMRGEGSRGGWNRGCVKRSVKRRRRGKESRGVGDMWRDVRGESESLKVSGVVRIRPLPRKHLTRSRQ